MSVPLAPAPWDLAGRGYVVAVRMPEPALEHGSFTPPGTQRIRGHRVALLMFVDYADSDVGPYHELLYVPGPLQIGPRRDLSITRIFVSTWASVINGENNWGIPKDRCDFDVRYGSDGVDRIALTAPDGTCFAEIELSASGLRWPAPGHWLPARWRTLSQLRDDQIYTYTPSARGHFKFARLRRWRFDPQYFPDLAQGKVIAAIKLTDFRMLFPVSKIQALVR